MFIRLIRHATWLLKNRSYINDNLLLLKHKAHTNQTSIAKIVEANLDNLENVLSFDSFDNLRDYRKFLKEGDRGFLAYIPNEGCVHRSWVQHFPRTVILHFKVNIKLSENQVFIHYCETDKDFRGKNVYPHVLSEIAEKYKGKEILICINEKNQASLKGANKSGFVPYKNYKIFGFLNMSRIKESKSQ